MSQVEEFRRIPVGQLAFSQTTAQKERRAHFDKAALEELAKSVADIGIMQPIVVRQLDGVGKFEVCAGERRVLAAKEAGLADIPDMVREISDEQLLELQLIENLQREGLHELAEAEGYEQLIEKFGMDVEQIMAKVGKSRSYVYGRLRLTSLCKAARDAFYEGLLNASTALDLAKIPVEALQKQALKEITKPAYRDTPLSVRDAREHIQKKYMLRLGDAGFSTSDATLVPKAGNCAACPKRTGNNPDLFGDVKGTDVCTDPVCFRSKIDAHAARAVAAAKKSGQTVLLGAAAKKVAPHGVQYGLVDHVRLDSKSHDHDQKTYAEVLGKDYVPVLLQDAESGALIKIVPRKDVPRPKRATSTGSSSGSTVRGKSQSNDDAKDRAKIELETKYNWELMKRIYEKAPTVIQPPLLARICEGLADNLDSDELDSVLSIAGIKTTGFVTTKSLLKLTASQLARLAYVLELTDRTPMRGLCGSDLPAAAKDLKIDSKKVREDVIAATKPAAAGAKTKAPVTKKKPAKKK